MINASPPGRLANRPLCRCRKPVRTTGGKSSTLSLVRANAITNGVRGRLCCFARPAGENLANSRPHRKRFDARAAGIDHQVAGPDDWRAARGHPAGKPHREAPRGGGGGNPIGKPRGPGRRRSMRASMFRAAMALCLVAAGPIWPRSTRAQQYDPGASATEIKTRANHAVRGPVSVAMAPLVSPPWLISMR